MTDDDEIVYALIKVMVVSESYYKDFEKSRLMLQENLSMYEETYK